MKPQVSVAIPAYNSAPYIDACLNSVLSQDVADLEVVVVDDASTDDTLEHLIAYARRDSRIKLFRHEKNLGLAATYDDALAEADGKYIALMDNDDYFSPGYLSLLLKMITGQRADVVQMGYRTFADDNGGEKTIARWRNTDQPLFVDASLEHRIALFISLKLHIAPWGKLYRADFIKSKKLKFYDAPLVPDLLFFYQSLLAAKRYLVLPETLYNYRLRYDSASHIKRFPEQTREYFAAMVKQMDHLAAWLKESGMFNDDRLAYWQVIDGFMAHYKLFFARHVQENGVDNVLSVLDELADETFNGQSAAFQSAFRAMIMNYRAVLFGCR